MASTPPPLQNISAGQTIAGFLLERVVPIAELHSTAYIFSHAETSARLMHLYNDEPENLFSIAFRTPVSDNTGVPHILEHSVLCGSKRFPVKDPFQEMLKGSLQTFLNALTYRDKTVYPVASQVEKDFYNLVNVYCDAVFHPLLSENTFFQEGWHFDVGESAKGVGIKGIVYNEMKGVFSDFASHVARRTIAGLMPDTTYAFESGGDPEQIADLTYEGFIAFYRRFYHPSNAFIFLYGNLPSEKTLRFLQDNYLHGYTAEAPRSAIAPQPRWQAPRTLAVTAPAPREDDGTATVLISWIFGDTPDPLSVLSGVVLGHYLLGTEISPLKRALIDSGLGQDLDDASGFDIEAIQSVFIAGLRKARPESAGKILEIVLATLRDQVEKGMDDDLIEGTLRQVEFNLREVNNGHMPYHLRLAERCYNSWLYGGDPLAHLAFATTIAALKERRKPGDAYFRELLRKNLLENPHRLLSVITASSEKGKELETQTEVQAARLSAAFGPDDLERYRRLTRELIGQQGRPASAEALKTLPRLSRTDLPPREFAVPCEISAIAGVPFYRHPLFTSDIVYFDIGFDLRGLPSDLIPYLPLYLELLRRCGAGTFTYEQMAVRTALATGGIGASTVCRTAADGSNELFFHAFVHGKALRGRFSDMLDIMHDLLVTPDLANRKQIQDLLLEERNNLSSAIIGNGHQIAMLSSSARLSRSRRIEEQLGGISQLRFLDRLARNGNAESTVPALERLHAAMINRNRCLVSVTTDDPELLREPIGAFLDRLPTHAAGAAPQWEAPGAGASMRGIEISAAINFAARSWKLGSFEAAAYGRLFLLARHLSTGYLWDKVRVEGGAYGGMAMMSCAHPIFGCASYRDPNLASTLRHFELGLKSVAAGVDRDALDQSIIASIGRIDAPRSPHHRGLGETIDRCAGYLPETRQMLREAILDATPEQLSAAAGKILAAGESAVTVLGSSSAFDAAQVEGVRFEREPLLPLQL
jgi:Zn-dependent M16 (insulinase) family peptidase